MKKELYSEIEDLIITWNLDGSKSTELDLKHERKTKRILGWIF